MALAAALLLVLFTSPLWAPPTLLVSFGLGLLRPLRVAVAAGSGLSVAVAVAILVSSRPAGAEGGPVVSAILCAAFLPPCVLVSAAGGGLAHIVRRRGTGRGAG